MEGNLDIVRVSKGPVIPYIDYFGKKHKYYVDWRIVYKNGLVKIVETKPFDILKLGLTGYFEKISIIPKLEVVEEYCNNRGFKFEFWTEKD